MQRVRASKLGTHILKYAKGSTYFTHCNESKPLEVSSAPFLLKTDSRYRLEKFHYFSTNSEDSLVDSITFERVCAETLESLTEYFEELVDSSKNLESADVSYSSGVLTVNLGKYGTYVINRQSPNRQIWLSSPFSGPKRYDYIGGSGIWVYKHDGQRLHHLLQDEISKIVQVPVDFSQCSYSN